MSVCNKNTDSEKSPDFYFFVQNCWEFPKVVKDSGRVGEESKERNQEWLLHPEKNVEGTAGLQASPFFLFSLLFIRKWNLNCCTNWGRKLLDKSSRKWKWWVLCCHTTEYINLQCLWAVSWKIRLLSAILLLPRDGSESVPYAGLGNLFSLIDHSFTTLLTGASSDLSSLVCGQGI